MKVLSALALFAALASAQYNGPKTVYIMPMASGLDQYLAQWLVKDGSMKVVTDPKVAEVVMTDRLGEAFEQKLKQIHPPEAKPEAKDDKKTEDNSRNTFRSTKARGTIFLVDARSREVVWSDYHKPSDSNSDRDLNRTAELIAHKLEGK